MLNVKLKNFKAFKDEFEKLELNNKNFLLYGENGSGKSSIYEALKVVFFKEKLETSIPEANIPEDQDQVNNDFWNQYKHNAASDNFEIQINDQSYHEFDNSSYQVFMIAVDKYKINDSLRLDTLIKSFDLSINNIDQFCLDNFENIQIEVNEQLKEFREENIKLTIDNEDDFSIQIKDTVRNLDYKNNISQYFNEAKLNLIILLVLFESIKHSVEANKTKILVLDDFITSLDISNRTFLVQYILKNFEDFQILIFTHNVYFYNLIMNILNVVTQTVANWKFGNLYEINFEHKLYIKGNVEAVADIKTIYNQGIEHIESIGNKIRQKFEVLLYELSKLLMIGAVEDSKKILEKIDLCNNVYFKPKINRSDRNRTATDLINEIEEILNSKRKSQVKSDLLNKIHEYKKANFNNIQVVLRKLKLYKKVTLHPMSHGTIGESSFTTSEIQESLELLQKFEGYVKGLINNNVDGA
jgi:energy-coupling factor transporter ATP-binding protein EcfA2